ncbi:uncharacterized protein LOC116013682 isoform X2 [Ipomoea triloba]|uniref:uncharacterized protein LOC116013682 isoform X2 n=1 Tax=Ipomoea triloba TaxID=35885 RepID=UPI00125DFF15|nr:uncharacterized protein LOC116013682 isoform X2 [Ipomoea triloba]
MEAQNPTTTEARMDKLEAHMMELSREIDTGFQAIQEKLRVELSNFRDEVMEALRSAPMVVAQTPGLSSIHGQDVQIPSEELVKIDRDFDVVKTDPNVEMVDESDTRVLGSFDAEAAKLQALVYKAINNLESNKNKKEIKIPANEKKNPLFWNEEEMKAHKAKRQKEIELLDWQTELMEWQVGFMSLKDELMEENLAILKEAGPSRRWQRKK